ERGGGDSVLARSCFGDDAGLTHPTGEQDLPQSIVHFVSASVTEIFPFQINLNFAQGFGEPLCKVKGGGPTHIIPSELEEFGLEGSILTAFGVGFFELLQRRNQSFRHVSTAEAAKMTIFVR